MSTKDPVQVTLDLMRRHPFPESAPVPQILKYEEPTKAEIEALDIGQKLALLSMSKTTRAQAIWAALREQFSAPPFTGQTFAQLRELGFADRPQDQKWHRLTVQGFRAAEFAADSVQTEYKIHQPFLLGKTGVNVTLMCTCGWGCGLRRGDNMQRNANSAHLRHMLTVSAVDSLATALAPRKTGAG